MKLKTKWIAHLSVQLVALGLLAVAGCGQGGKKPDQNLQAQDAKADGGSNQNETKGEKPDKAANPPDAAEIKLSPVDLAGYQALVKSHTGKVVLTDAWATW